MNKIIELIITDLTNDKIKTEIELERLINKDINIDEKVEHVKTLLTKLTLTEFNLTKFTSMINQSNNNDNIQTT